MAVMKKESAKTLAFDLLFDIVGSIFYAVGIYTFAKTADFAPGGLSGLALIINYLWGLPIGVMTLALNIPFVLLSYKIVGRRFLLKTARTMLFCTFFLDLVFPHVKMYNGSPLLAALYSGLFLGAGLALFYMRGSSSGGIDFLTVSIKTLKPHVSLGGVTMAVDLVVILLGWPVFGNVDSVLYGLLSAAAASLVMDKIMYGVGAGKLLIVITTKGQAVADEIARVCGRGSTIVYAQGSYTGANRQILLCACAKAEAYKVRSAACRIDENAFVMVSETSEVFGEGFIEPEKKKR